MKRAAALLALVGLWLPLAAATPLPLKPPPPDVTPLIPPAKAPIDKPPVPPPDVTAPAPPSVLPPVPAAPIVMPSIEKPTAYLAPPRALPCVGAWLRITSESLECGRARFAKGEYEDAMKALDQAVRGATASDHEFLNEARYWLAETLYRLNRVEQADWLFRQVAQDAGRADQGPWALHSSGWTALRVHDAARARDTFTQVLAVPHPAVVDGFARHGLALALYALGQYKEAQSIWADLIAKGVPAGLERDIAFWNGEALGRIERYAQGAQELARFGQTAGAHPLLDTALVHRGWWSLQAGSAADSLTAFRAYLNRPSAATVASENRAWAQAGLGLALVVSNDAAGARAFAQALDSQRSPLALPVWLALVIAAVEAKQFAVAQTTVQELLAESLQTPVRAWLLALRGDAARLDGNRDDARTQYDLARQAEPASATGRYATYRLAQTNVDLREFAQAVTDVTPLVTAPLPRDMLLAALLLQGDAAYYAGNFAVAAAAWRRALTEFPDQPSTALVKLSAAWTALRQNQAAEARRQFLDFATAAPTDPYAVDALVLASELTMTAGDLNGARDLLDRIIATYPTHPRTDFARMNRALLMIRGGQSQLAIPLMRDWLRRAPFPPLAPRAHAILGIALLNSGARADAGKELTQARAEGLGAVASLGLGALALAQDRLDDAVREFGEARDSGSPQVASVAQYGLAVVAFNRGAPGEFKKSAQAALDGDPKGPAAPRILYVLAGLATEDKDWPTALATAKRLVSAFPNDETADNALERVGGSAAKAANWPVALEAYTLLRQRYPQSPFVQEARLGMAEALISLGRPEQARADLEQITAATPPDPRAPQAWVLLARVREAAGDRAGALDAYAQAAPNGKGLDWSNDALLGNARLLMQDNRWDEARVPLERAIKGAEGVTAAEAALALGETYSAQGEHLAAAEYYMTAAYLAPESTAGRRALVGAGKSFATLKQPDAAETVYRKLLAQSGVPADLADAARRGLVDIKR